MMGSENPVFGKGYPSSGGLAREEWVIVYKMTNEKLFRVAKKCSMTNFVKQLLRNSIYFFPHPCYNHPGINGKERGGTWRMGRFPPGRQASIFGKPARSAEISKRGTPFLSFQ